MRRKTFQRMSVRPEIYNRVCGIVYTAKAKGAGITLTDFTSDMIEDGLEVRKLGGIDKVKKLLEAKDDTD